MTFAKTVMWYLLTHRSPSELLGEVLPTCLQAVLPLQKALPNLDRTQTYYPCAKVHSCELLPSTSSLEFDAIREELAALYSHTEGSDRRPMPGLSP